MNVPDSRPTSSAEDFRRSGYTVRTSAIGNDSARYVATYALLQRNWPGYYQSEKMFHAALGRYADALSETLLLELKPVVEQATGLELLPCYSYLRIYGNGAILPRHLDRPSCEISTSLTLGFEAPEPWPLWVEAASGDKALTLLPGDMLIYRGADVPHWRETFSGNYWVQTFLHYVDAHGEYTDFKFDGRETIGPFDRLTMRRNFSRHVSSGQQDGATTVNPDAPCPCNSGLRFRDCHGRSKS